ncbi:MAG: fibronectin type III domain-containing protein [Bacteroidota bacterium]
MKRFKLQSLFVSAIMCAFIAAGCNDNDDVVTPPSTAPAAPTGLVANSKDYQSVRLKWTASTSAKAADFKDYELTVTTPNGATPVQTLLVNKDSTGTIVTGLTEGVIYTFSLKSRSTAASSNTSAAASVKWSPADRYSNVRMYETKSTTFGSGISFKNSDTALLVSQGNLWDIGLDTRDEGGVPSYDIGSPSKLSYTLKDASGNTITPRATLLSSKIYEGVASLDDLFDTQVLGEAALNMKPDTARRISFTTSTQNFVFFAKTEEGNYAKILVKSANGKILQGIAPNRYVLMDISYQAAPNVPYASVRGAVPPAFTTSAASSVKKIATE